MTPRRVLAAIHGLPHQDEAIVRVAAHMATAMGCNMTVLSVQSPAAVGASVPAASTPTTEPATERDSHTALEALVSGALVGSPTPISWDVQVVTGDAECEVARLAMPEHTAAVVVGRSVGQHEQQNAYDFVNSLRSARVCQSSAVPVVVVAPSASGHDPFDRVVVATDFSASSWYAAEAAARASSPKTEFHVVHVAPATALANGPAYREAMRSAVSGWASSLSALLPPSARLSVDVLTGMPYAELRRYLDKIDATAVAVGGHRVRETSVSALGYSVPERFLAEWPGTLVSGPCE
jgi:hypothetical protein